MSQFCKSILKLYRPTVGGCFAVPNDTTFRWSGFYYYRGTPKSVRFIVSHPKVEFSVKQKTFNKYLSALYKGEPPSRVVYTGM